MGLNLNKIFSIKNVENRKIITFLGIKIKIKRSCLSIMEKEIAALKEEVQGLRILMNNSVDITKCPKARGNLREVQKSNVLLLKIFDGICKKHNIKYWMDYGTLLGAVRHKGFIPWDDDLDVAMLREDYDKMIDILNSELSKHGFSINEGKGFRCQVIRLMYKNTPVQIDIFPYDSYDKSIYDDNEKKSLINKIKYCNKKFFEKYSNEKLHADKFPRQELSQMQKENILENRDINEIKTIFSGCEALGYETPNTFAYEQVFPLKKIIFEELELSAPCMEVEYLTSIYGDFMSFPNFKISGHGNISKNKEENMDELINILKNIDMELLKK